MAIPNDRIVSIIAAEAGLDETKLRRDATFEELDIGSLDMASALFTLEDELGIEIDPASIPPSSTIGNLIDRIAVLAQK